MGKEMKQNKKISILRLFKKLPGFGEIPKEEGGKIGDTKMPPRGGMGHGRGHGPGASFAGGKARNTKKTLSRLMGYFKNYKGILIAALVAVIITSIFTSATPMLMGRVVNAANENVGGSLPQTFFTTLSIFVTAVLIMAVFQGAAGWIFAGISQKVVFYLRQTLFSKIQLLSLKFFDSREKGDLMSRLTNDVETVTNVLSNSASQLISSVFGLVITLVFMFSYNWKLALIALIPIPLSVLLTKYVAAMSRKFFYQRSKALGSVNGFIEEVVTGQHVVSIYCQEDEEERRFAKRNKRFRELSIRAQALTGIMMPTINMINNVGFALLAAAGAWFVIKGWADVGQLLAFFMYARNFGRPIAQLGQIFAQVQSALAGTERVFEIIDEIPEVQDKENAKEVDLKGHVVFKGVDFSYVPDVPVLKNVSLEARPGEMVALVGPTGAGKTTIINLLTRFYDIQSGSITLDGYEIKDIKKDNLRGQLGIVLQDTYLFAESVEDNIRYGRLDASHEEIRKAAKMAYSDQFIHRLPEGYQTKLSEEGGNISQGQRQLLAITRAMLADPAILILDEATSSVDTRTEVHIQKAMLELMKGRTSFVIAHRLSTIQSADQILVINDGEIVEKGRHEELLEKKGYYHDLYYSQFAVEEQTA